MTPQEYLDWCRDMSERMEKYEYHITNADRIRSMTDEELANWLAIISSSKPQSSPEWLEWLRKEAET